MGEPRRTASAFGTLGEQGPDEAAPRASRADTASVLFQLTDHLYRARSLEEAYDAALDAISDVMGTGRASILRFDMAGTMRFVAWRGLSDAYRRIADGHSPWRRGVRDAEPIYVEDIHGWTCGDELKQAILREGIRALAFIPLTDDGQVAGKFMVYHETPHAFSAAEREVALTIARQLGFSIQRQLSTEAAHRLAALVESSDDAIISVDLDSVIQSWNRGAESLFGYAPAEVIGRQAGLLIPADRQDEEPLLLGRIRTGERVKHYETVRRRKDGSTVDISLSISPILDLTGKVIGASKIARDIGERRRAQEQQRLLLREMNHRIMNLFALTSSIVTLSARTAGTPRALAEDVSDRLQALARAHALTVPSAGGGELGESPTLHALIRAILAPYGPSAPGQAPRFSIEGADAFVKPEAIATLSLVLHELATNAAKYGALSTEAGGIGIRCEDKGGHLEILWREHGGPSVPHAPRHEGFGTRLLEAGAAQLGPIARRWEPDGLRAELSPARSHFGDTVHPVDDGRA